MGIRFRCHQCGHELHVKDFQGGKRSKCPECETRFRIPAETTDYSIPLDNSQSNESALTSTKSQASTAQASKPQAAKPQASKPQASQPLASESSEMSSSVATGTLPAASILSKPSSPESETEGDPEVSAESEAPQEFDSVSDPASDAFTQPQAILEAPGATWYVRPPAGGQYGPAPANIFCEWLTEHRVTADSLVWRDGWPQWLVAREVFVDYFGPAVPPNELSTFDPSTAPIDASDSSVTSLADKQPIATDFVAPTSLSDRALAARKRQRKKNYMIMIGILGAISVGLVIALVVVLMRNS